MSQPSAFCKSASPPADRCPHPAVRTLFFLSDSIKVGSVNNRWLLRLDDSSVSPGSFSTWVHFGWTLKVSSQSWWSSVTTAFAEASEEVPPVQKPQIKMSAWQLVGAALRSDFITETLWDAKILPLDIMEPCDGARIRKRATSIFFYFVVFHLQLVPRCKLRFFFFFFDTNKAADWKWQPIRLKKYVFFLPERLHVKPTGFFVLFFEKCSKLCKCKVNFWD